MAFIKTLTIDDFYTPDQAEELYYTVRGLQYTQHDIGQQIDNFNHVPDYLDEVFSTVLRKKIVIDVDRSGVFRFTEPFIHFEDFQGSNEWLFVVALQPTMFNLFEHQSGVKSALDGYQFNYQNMFEWNLKVNYELDPGQGVFFRPWLFHSFTKSLIQIFRLREEQ